jgi:multidrug efflux pump subunit AcrA (membrane-fusion protein)
MQRFGLVLETAEVKNLADEIEVAATVQPDETLTTPVSSLVPGRAEQVRVRLGDSVTRGQVLATIRSDEVATIQTDFLKQLLDLRAETRQRFLELQAEAKQLTTKAEFLRKQYQRKKFLVENKIGSKAELESAESELLQAESALEAAGAKQKSAMEAAAAKEQALFITSKEKLKLHGMAESEIDRVAKQKTIKGIFDIRAPKSGLITSREIDPGETTDANQHLFVITDLSRVWMIGQIFEKDVSRLSVGMEVTCSVDSYPGRQFKGHLEYLGSKLDAQTRTLPIRASVVNSDYKLRPDMFGQISLRAGTIHTLAVSRKALQKIGETPILYVKSGDDAYTERRVIPGLIVRDQVQIVSGLAAGERVVTEGSIHLVGSSLQRLKK